MSPKLGRPTDNPRNKILQIRISDKEKEMLNFCTQKTGKSQTDIVLEGIKRTYQELKGK